MIENRLALKYEEKKFQESERFLKLFIIAGPLTYLGFAIADYLKYPEQIIELVTIRGLFGLFVLASYFICRKNPSFKKNQYCKMSWSIAATIGISYMLYITDGPNSAYYSGINLVAIFALMFGTYDKNFFKLTIIGTYLPYYIVCMLQYDKFVDLREFFVLSIFNIGTMLGIILTYYKRESDLNSIINAELALENELANRERIILQKTEEATHLNQLSSQFSPQVVKAIKDGKISIEKDVQRVKICAIFIDIVNSTEKVTTLNEKDVQATLERFLDSCLTVFLKYDLTIDKFHGDGVLAYSNMPIAREDFIERTCLAAFETVNSIKNDREFYLKHWQSDLQVRVGISVGYANVGFYGNKKYFKTFTAIGTPLPYASRLTSAAEPNQILVDHEIEKRLSKFNYNLKNCGVKTLKGFEKDINFVYQLISIPIAESRNLTVKTCPEHSNSVLFLDTNSKGHFVFKCRECDYEDTSMNIDDSLLEFKKTA
jgi:adenylate cyclase